MKIKQNKVSFDTSDLQKIQSLPEQVVFCGKVGQWYILKHTECSKWGLTDNLEIIPLCWFWCLHSILRMKCIY